MGEASETSENNNASSSSSSTGNEQTDSNQTSPSLKEETVEEPSRAFPEAFQNSGFPFYPNLVGAEAANFGAPLLPMMYPAPFPGFFPFPAQDHGQGQQHQQGGIYAVPVLPFTAFPYGGLIPVAYNLPTGTTAPGSENARSDGSNTQSDTGRGSPAEAREDLGPAGLRQRHGAPAGDAQGQRPDHQRQVVRRFQVGFQLDLLLIMKLAVVVFVFNQDGPKERLFLLLFLATLVYLYQTGALAPLLQWLSRSAQRAGLPHQAPARAVQPHVARPEGPQEVGNDPNVPNVERQDPQPAAMEQVPNGPDGARVNERVDPQGLNWWGFVKEVQMLVVGFVTSLLPGFHHAD